jgi:hypothetical protein
LAVAEISRTEFKDLESRVDLILRSMTDRAEQASDRVGTGPGVP